MIGVKDLKFYADPENVTFPCLKNSHNKNYGYKYICKIFILRQQTKVYFVKLQFMQPMIFTMIFSCSFAIMNGQLYCNTHIYNTVEMPVILYSTFCNRHLV